MCKVSKNPISGLGEAYKVQGRTDRAIPIYPQTLFAGYKNNVHHPSLLSILVYSARQSVINLLKAMPHLTTI